MGSKSEAPPAPNYAPIAQASQQQADQQYALGTAQLQWAQQQYAQEYSQRQSVYGALFDQANFAADLQQQQLDAGRSQTQTAFDIQNRQLDFASQQQQISNYAQERQLSLADQTLALQQRQVDAGMSQADRAYELQQLQLDYARQQQEVANQVQARQLGQADNAFGLQQQSFDYARQQDEANRAITQQVTNANLAAQAQNQANAQQDRLRYQDTYQPLEDKLVSDAASFSSDARKDLEVGRAQSGVAQQFESARQAAQQNLEAFGVNPGSTRFAALDIGTRAQQAAAQAAAGNQASQYVDATGRALRSEAINVGRGYPGQIAGTYGTALAAGSGAVNSSLAATASGANTMGTAVQYAGVGNAASGGALQAGGYGANVYAPALQSGQYGLGAYNPALAGAGAANAAYGSALSTGAYGNNLFAPSLQTGAYGLGAFNPAASSSSAVTGALNGGANALAQSFGGFNTANSFFQNSNNALGTGLNAMSTGYNQQLAQYNANQNSSSGVGSALGLGAGLASKFFGFAEGGGVPQQASPTMGRAIDDVPARLTAGEFVVPKSAVEWFGQKHFHNLISKADQERVRSQRETGAVPAVHAVPQQPPAFVSRSAIPMQRAV